MNNIKHEYRYLLELLKGQKKLKRLRTGWSKHHLFKIISVYLFIDILLNIIIIIPLYLLFEQFFDTYNEFLENDFEIILLGVLIVPFIEELLFRWPMVYKEQHFKLLLVLVSLILIPVYWHIGLALLISVFYLVSFDWKKDYKYDIEGLHAKYSRHIFWILTVSFALVHMSNYDFQSIPIWVYPFMVIPQFIGGALLGLVRIRFGLRYSIIMHSLFNLFAFGGDLIFG
jgi:hypothetical protein